MINENNNALEIEIFLILFLALSTLPPMVILTVHAQCDLYAIASVFIYFYWVIFPDTVGLVWPCC